MLNRRQRLCRYSPTCGKVETKNDILLIVTGGRPELESDLTLGTTEIYSFNTGVWSQGPNVPRNLTRAGRYNVDNEFYVIGGDF